MLPTLILWQRQSPFHLKKDGVTWVNKSCIRVSRSFEGMSMGYVKWKFFKLEAVTKIKNSRVMNNNNKQIVTRARDTRIIVFKLALVGVEKTHLPKYNGIL